jgi:hypothetical protein
MKDKEKINQKEWTEKNQEELEDRIVFGQSPMEIGKAIGVTPERVLALGLAWMGMDTEVWFSEKVNFEDSVFEILEKIKDEASDD